jgi:hypothetical protein
MISPLGQVAAGTIDFRLYFAYIGREPLPRSDWRELDGTPRRSSRTGMMDSRAI